MRSTAAVAGIVVLALAFGIRALADGPLEQHSGTALYASLIYTIVVFAWPRVKPLMAAAVTTGICWAIELAQLTGVPAALSQRSLLGRLALGAHFDPVDLIWYPVGALILMVLHWRVPPTREGGRD